MSNLASKLRELVDSNFPDSKRNTSKASVTRAISYSNSDSEITVSFRDNLPTPSKSGWLISEILKLMEEEGYPRIAYVHVNTSVEAGLKMSIVVKTKRLGRKMPSIPAKNVQGDEDEETIASISGNNTKPLPCKNCGESSDTDCACMRNKCIECGGPVGNITFTSCDKCWDKNKASKETVDTTPNTKKEDLTQSMVIAMEYGYLQCEKGNNLTQALLNFEKVLTGKKVKK